MIFDATTAESQAILNTAFAMCAAARTAPKACGQDHLVTAVLTGGELDALIYEMRRMASELDASFFARDAENVLDCYAVVLLGVEEKTRGLNEKCTLCHYKNCADCAEHNGCCVFDAMDLGIALGSAVSLCADRRIDNRIMFTIGKAAAALGLLGDVKMIMGIPLSASGKSPFFDRKPTDPCANCSTPCKK